MRRKHKTTTIIRIELHVMFHKCKLDDLVFSGDESPKERVRWLETGPSGQVGNDAENDVISVLFCRDE